MSRTQSHVDYSDLPAFQSTSVEGHVSALTVGRMGLQRVAMLGGRKHTYESGDCAGMAGALRSLKRWGVKLLAANQCGRQPSPDHAPRQLDADHRPHQRHPALAAGG
jgi:purine nucleoside phosphorylase